MKVVVTGGTGFIGSNIVNELNKVHDVIIINDSGKGNLKNLKDFKGIILDKDIRDLDWNRLLKKKNIDVIFHQAAITDTRISDKKLMMDVNTNSFKKILEYCAKNNIKLIYASSAAVYGREKSPMKEEQELKPLNVYGYSKMVMDELAKEYMKKYPKLNIIGLRYFNVFGPGESHKKRMASMIYQLSEQMKTGKRPKVFKYGEQTRDHIYVKDVVQANLRFLDYNGSGIFNVGIGKETSFNDIINYLNEVLGTKLKPNYIDNPYDFFQDRTCADITKIKNTIGFRPKFSVLEGIRDYFKNTNSED